MRILIAGASPKDLATIRQVLSQSDPAHDLMVAASAPELAKRLKRDQPSVLLAASSSLDFLDASAILRLSAEVNPGCICIGLAAKGEQAEARNLFEAGAYDAFPMDQLWRLPLALRNALAYAESERRLRERTATLEAATKELEEFARSISHDMRSPLSVIVGYSDLLSDDSRVDLSMADRAKVTEIRAAAMRMNALIDDMLRLSQVIQREVEPRRVNLTALAEDILAKLAASGPERKVETLVESGLWVVADPVLMRIAMESLISNAWKYTSKKEIAHIEVGRKDVPGKGQAIYVRDDGAGFDMEQGRRLFKPFQRMHSLSEFPGTGIGLVTVSRVLEKHGGSIWVEAEKEIGATFYFELGGASGAAPASAEYEDASSSGR
jgi:signal transduction histidine kinase